jgi:hypothetical protein
MKFFCLKNILITFGAAIIISSVIIFAEGYTGVYKGNTDVCLSCHEDKNLYTDKEGKKVSMYIDEGEYKNSAHSMAECIDCHENYDPDELPHTKSKPGVNCQVCHKDLKGLESSVHSKVGCADCHAKHNIKMAKDFEKGQTTGCLNCHKSKNIQLYKSSVHSKIGCESCHYGGHDTKMIPKPDVSSVCGKCHGEHQKDFNNSIHQTVLHSGNKNAPTCTDCHGSHQIYSSKMSIESKGCLKCHLDEKLFPGEEKGSAKFVERYRTSVHASIDKDGAEAAGCSDCHGNHEIQQPVNPKSYTTRTRLPETCGKCHKDIMDKYFTSAHGKALLNKSVAAPTCVDCHSEHSIKAVRKADEFSKINQVEMCLNCHINGKLPHKNYKGEEVLISNYKDSYHYSALKEGKTNAATCSDCHGSHEMKKSDDPTSKVYKKNIAKTCGQTNCHVKQLNEYTGSIHEVSLNQKNNSDATTCTNCHGNHQILRKDEKSNRISNSKGLVQLCSDCHNSVEMIEKYDLPSDRTETYMSSYHGLATRGGSQIAANCESCHGYHNIRPSSDSLSTIAKKNLAQTCGKCHPGAEQTLLLSKIHQTNASKESPVLFWITKFYIVLIVLTIGGMVVHNTIDFAKKVKYKNGHKKETTDNVH